jgi:hypothetical protein
MPSLLRPLTKMFAAWMVVGSGALIVVSLVDQDTPKTPILATVEPIPCKQQAWPMIDRKCLAWTAPDKTKAAGDDVRPAERVASLVNAKPEETIEARPAETKPAEIKAAPAEAPVVAATEPKPEPVALRTAIPADRPATPRAALRPAPVTRNPALSEITVQARSTVGVRTIVIRPTTPQDALYYAARRNVASAGPVSR